MSPIARCVAFVLMCHIAPAGAFSQPSLPETPAGERMTGFVSAFNAGEAAMREFISRNWAASALQSVPLDVRIDRYRAMREALGDLRLHRVLTVSDAAVSTVMQSLRSGWVEISFGFDDSERRAITWMSIQPTDDPDQPPVQRSASAEELVGRAASYLDSLTAREVFSGAVLIARGDSILFRRAYGDLDREAGIPARDDTRYNLGSINKTFTRIAIHQLEAEGKVALADTIGRFLPEYPNPDAARSVTVAHLLSMRSGIGDFFGERYAAAEKESILTLEDYLPLFADKPLEFPPGTASRYSNGGYVVLGLIVERASGMDYFEYVRERIFEPAGMSSSGWFPKASLPPNAARGYTSGRKESNYPMLPGRGSSAGGGYSTVDDLFRFVRALRSGMFQLPDIEDGLGIAGGAPGLNAALEWDATSGFAVIVLSNFDPPVAERTARHLTKLLPE